MKRNYHTNMAFLDLLFNTLLCFAALFVLSFILINPSKKENNIKAKADFMITVTWNKDLDDDVDTYVEDPVGNLVAFMRREEGLMHLDRDDLGHRNDTINTPNGPIEYKDNREIVTLRGFIPGEYVVNVHMYMKREIAPTEVTIVLEKLNPYMIIMAKNVILTTNGQEDTAFRFVVDSEGSVTKVNELKKTLVKSKVGPL
jgi:hypothetical protein|tara:strand:- start:482 stop:1081 length:600 start_codon:yes stop_codon:yes gene_type:complete